MREEVEFEIKFKAQFYDETAEEVQQIIERLLVQNNHLFRNIGQVCVAVKGRNRRHLLEYFFVSGKVGKV